MRTYFTLLAALLFSTLFVAQNPVTINMCAASQASSTSATGTIFDSGGPFNSYQNGEYCTLLINPACAVNLSITFQQFSVETCCDGLRVFDGDNANAPLLGDVRFATIPVTYTPTSGKLFLSWVSDGSTIGSGFRATWTSTLVNAMAPEATVSVSDATPALKDAIQFQAFASNYPDVWAWNFGDGQTSLEQNPEHAYQSSGQYTAQLIVTNCHSFSDTVTQLITVQEPPAPVLNPTPLTFQTACADTARATFTLHNEGAGDLLFSSRAESVLGRQKVLIYGYQINTTSLYGVQSLLANFPDMFEVFNTQASDNASLATALQGMDLLLVPRMSDWANYWIFVAQMPAVHNFIENGGGVVVCGSKDFNYFLGGTSLLLVGNGYSTTEYSYTGLPFSTQHPIVEGMPLVYFSPNFVGALTVIDPEYTSLCTLNELSVVGYKQFDAGRLVYLGFDFQSQDSDLRNLLKNALRWANKSSKLTVQPNSGRVAPGDSILFELTVNTEGLTTGNYTGEVIFNINHPTTPELTLPFNLLVTGQAIVQPQSDQLNFGDLMQLRTAKQSLLIKNPGCDTLKLTNIFLTNPAFTSNKASLEISPFDEDSLTVTFFPIDTGWFQGVLVLQTATGQTDIPVNGRGLGAPIVNITPLSMEATISCNDTAVLHLTLENSGLGDLEVVRKFAGASAGSSRILIFDELTFNSTIPYQISNQIQAAYPTAEILHYISNGSFNDLPTLLANTDVVILPAIGSGLNEWYITIGSYLQDYVHAGGFVLIIGTPYSDKLNLLGLAQVEPYHYNTYGIGSHPLAQHPLLENVALEDPVYDEAWSLEFVSAAYKNLSRIYGAPVETSLVGYQNIGNGTVAYVGYEQEYVYNTSNKLLINALEWGGAPGWLEVINDTMVVAQGGSTELDIYLNAAEIAAGVYSYNLLLATNDPLMPLLTVPVTIMVEGEPELDIAFSNLSFGVIQQFGQKTETIEVSNLGCDTLHILSFSSNNNAFVIPANNPTVVKPYSSAEFTVVFAPQTPGNAVGILTMTTDGGDKTLNVSGLTIGAPIVLASPTALTIDLECGDVFNTPVTLSNNGLGNLSYRIGQSPNNQRIALFNVYAYYGRFNAIQSQLTAMYPTMPLMTIPLIEADALADSLAKVDILLIPSLDGPLNDYYGAYRPVIQSFLESGGLVFVIGVYNYPPLVQLGLFNEIDYYYQNSHTVEKLMPTHPILDGVAAEFSINDYISLAVFPPAEEVVTLLRTKHDQQTYLGVKSYGLGQIVFWGNNFDSSPTGQLLNIFESLIQWAENPLPPGVRMSGLNSNIAPGDSQQFELQINTTGVSGGTHAGFMRVRSNDPQNPAYKIPVNLNMSQRPCAVFNYDVQYCSKNVLFQDFTVNPLSSWYWQFGDGNESFEQNPQHDYAASGTYTVSLIGCNFYGCDTIVNSIVVPESNGPLVISCAPQTVSYCCQTGIYQVHLNAIQHYTTDGQSGYQNYSCTVGSLLAAGEQYPISIITGPSYSENVRVWIDYNNNGVFNANELVFSDYAFQNHTGFVTIPGSAVKNTRLRMRVSSDINNVPTACSDVSNGQVEDYWVEIRTTIATNEPDSELKMSLFPNPSSGKVWLKLEQAQAETCLVQIHDAAGKLCWTDEVAPNGEAILLPALAQGAYFVKVQSEKAVKLERLIIVD